MFNTSVKFVGAIVAIFFSGMHEFFGFLLSWIFCAIAFGRGIRMLKWPSPPVSAFSVKRLRGAGIVLMILSVFLAAQSLAFLGYWPDFRNLSREEAFRKFVVFQIAYAQSHQRETGNLKFHRLSKSDPHEILWMYESMDMRGFSNVGPRYAIEYGPEDKSFTAFLFPSERFPFFPFNYMTAQPSLRAGECGDIRKVLVHHHNDRCPPNAPVVILVSSNDVAVARETMDRKTSGSLPPGQW